MKYLTLLTALAGSALAIPESYEAVLQKGTCEPFGDTFQTGTGWGMVPDLVITPSHTGTEVDGMKPMTNTHTQRMMSPYDYFVFKEETGAFYRIACTDEDALHFASSETIPLRVFNSYTGDGRLVPGLGLTPEGYEVFVDGESIGGGFLGMAGVVRWGFSDEEEGKEGVVARLMLPGVQEREGEVYGFLEVKERGS